jgi:hypothetical protein
MQPKICIARLVVGAHKLLFCNHQRPEVPCICLAALSLLLLHGSTAVTKAMHRPSSTEQPRAAIVQLCTVEVRQLNESGYKLQIPTLLLGAGFSGEQQAGPEHDTSVMRLDSHIPPYDVLMSHESLTQHLHRKMTQPAWAGAGLHALHPGSCGEHDAINP